MSRRSSGAFAALSSALLVTIAAGCGELGQSERDARSDAEAVRERLGELHEEAGSRWSSIRVSKRPWLAIETIEPRDGEGLPAALSAPDGVTLPLADIESDNVLAARIEAATEVEVRLVGPSAGTSPAEGFARALGDGWTPAAGIWTGPLARLLDAWSAVGGYE